MSSPGLILMRCGSSCKLYCPPPAGTLGAPVNCRHRHPRRVSQIARQNGHFCCSNFRFRCFYNGIGIGSADTQPPPAHRTKSGKIERNSAYGKCFDDFSCEFRCKNNVIRLTDSENTSFSRGYAARCERKAPDSRSRRMRVPFRRLFSVMFGRIRRAGGAPFAVIRVDAEFVRVKVLRRRYSYFFGISPRPHPNSVVKTT